ncbi:hypothetical protein [Bacteriovorax sp. DB6_IX]|uniref:hypothetical protein n=1 Tax=Bacteriovorax sp. DB6_IX TaxID=1353530 RepID=UPI00038A077E|nr:hypothetical protein [Bacteriovorax sp. DB6_IX]EQC50430.1 hypothetical protein M901_1505 [Bacteriovorax sp. DB6_IX]
MELNFLDIFYRMMETFKNEFKGIIGYILALSFVSSLTMIFSGATDTATIITVGLTEAIVGSLITVLFLNFFLAKLRGVEFSSRKAFWDYPTFVFYNLGFGILCLLGFVALIIPGLLVLYFFLFSPIVSILFDTDNSSNNTKEEGILHKTKRFAAVDYSVYTIVFVISMAWEGVSLFLSRVVDILGNQQFVILPVSFISATFTLLILALIVTFLESASQKLQNDHQ